MILVLILQILSNSTLGLVSNTWQKDFSYAWWLRKVDLMRDFLGAFFNLCGLMLGTSEIYMSPRSPPSYLVHSTRLADTLQRSINGLVSLRGGHTEEDKEEDTEEDTEEQENPEPSYPEPCSNTESW